MESLDCGEANAPERERRKAVKILARSLFQEMIGRRYDWSLVVAFATELIELISDQIRPQSGEPEGQSLPIRSIDHAQSKSSDDFEVQRSHPVQNLNVITCGANSGSEAPQR